MNRLKIAIGTESEQKIGYLKEVLAEIGLDAKFIPNDVPSGVSDQPLTDEETKTGSLNRARNALELNVEADFAMGIEVGYHEVARQRHEIFCYASIVDKTGYKCSCCSSKFLLPEYHQDKINRNLRLGDYVREYLNLHSDPAAQFMGELLRGRRPFIIESVRSVLLQYLRREEF
ncbi:MAG: DUF84 family protein [archaeon]